MSRPSTHELHQVKQHHTHHSAYTNPQLLLFPNKASSRSVPAQLYHTTRAASANNKCMLTTWVAAAAVALTPTHLAPGTPPAGGGHLPVCRGCNHHKLLNDSINSKTLSLQGGGPAHPQSLGRSVSKSPPLRCCSQSALRPLHGRRHTHLSAFLPAQSESETWTVKHKQCRDVSTQ